MPIYIIVIVSVKDEPLKVANWVQQATAEPALSDIQTEVVDLKEWDLPLFAGAHPPATGIYDQPKTTTMADKIAQAQAFIFISPEYNHGYSPALKMPWTMSAKNGKAKLRLLSAMVQTNGSRSMSQIRQVALV